MYRGNRNIEDGNDLFAALGKPNKEKRSFIPEETKQWGNQQKPSLAQSEYGFESFAMMIPEARTATYMNASQIQ